MPTILALGLAAAAYPQLLAVVVVILTRPNPQRLLWACYLGSVSISVGCWIAILLVFRHRGSVAGSTSHRLGASVFLVVGAMAVLLALMTATERGRGLLGGGVRRLRLRRYERPAEAPSAGERKSRTERALAKGSIPVAAAVGIVLGVPGPFDLLALGRMARGSYTAIASIVMLVAFNLTKFLLIEIPIVTYAFDPDGTSGRVDRFSAWMKLHQIKVVAAVVGIVGLVLIGRGISQLS
jgi:hypothetical protein